jgi:hypothetical protein
MLCIHILRQILIFILVRFICTLVVAIEHSHIICYLQDNLLLGCCFDVMQIIHIIQLSDLNCNIIKLRENSNEESHYKDKD